MDIFSDSMTFEEKKEILNTVGEELESQCILIDGYEGGLVGYSIDDSGGLHAVYDYERSLRYMANNDNMPIEDVEEHWSYNTERSLPYIKESERPIIIHLFNEDMV